METMVTIPRLLRLVDDSSGATAVEYALIVSAIAGIVAGVVYFVGAKTNNLYTRRLLLRRFGADGCQWGLTLCRWIADPRPLAPTEV